MPPGVVTGYFEASDPSPYIPMIEVRFKGGALAFEGGRLGYFPGKNALADALLSYGIAETGLAPSAPTLLKRSIKRAFQSAHSSILPLPAIPPALYDCMPSFLALSIL